MRDSNKSKDQLVAELAEMRQRLAQLETREREYRWSEGGRLTERKKAQEEIVRLYLAERERYEEAEALRRATLVLASSLDLDQVIEHILVELQQVVPYDSASVQLLHGNYLKLIGGRGFVNLPELMGSRFQLNDDNPTSIVLATLEPMIIGDVEAEYPTFNRAPHDKTNTRGWMGVPLHVGEKVVGVLTLDKQQPYFYTPAYAQVATAYAVQAAIAIENARLHAETEKRAQQLTVLYELDRAILTSLRLKDIYQTFARHTARLLAYDHMSITLLEGNELSLAYIAGLGKIEVGAKLSLKGATLGWVIQHRQSIIRHNLTADSAVNENDLFWNVGIESAMVLPLQVRRRVIGTWNIGSRGIGVYSSDDLSIAQAMADQLALSIENAQLYQQAQQEIAERKQAQAALELERASLAQRVEERTAELQVANAELARAARLKDEFLANMSHELRTPLNAVLGMAEILKEGIYGPLNEAQARSAEVIMESGQHLLNLINDILDLSKIGAGKLDLTVTHVSVEAICQTSLQFIRQQAFKKQLKLSFRSDPAVSMVQVDERRLKQILVNLLSNAVKFTPDGGAVGLEVVGDQEEGVIHFVVWDTGIGIAPESMNRLFQPFVQLDGGLTRHYEGTGLGLSLVYRLVDLHGGSVSVVSEGIAGRGSRFTVSLPWQPQPPPAEERGIEDREWRIEDSTPVPGLSSNEGTGENSAPSSILYSPSSSASALSSSAPLLRRGTEEAASPPAGGTEGGAQPLILLAEDNEANLKTLSSYLTGRGFRVVVVQNGSYVLTLAAETQPDLILMDIQMPGLDGLEVIRRLRRDPKLAITPVITLTALAMSGDEERCLQAGADLYLSKPVNLQRLAQIIKQQLNNRRLRKGELSTDFSSNL